MVNLAQPELPRHFFYMYTFVVLVLMMTRLLAEWAQTKLFEAGIPGSGSQVKVLASSSADLTFDADDPLSITLSLTGHTNIDTAPYLFVVPQGSFAFLPIHHYQLKIICIYLQTDDRP